MSNIISNFIFRSYIKLFSLVAMVVPQSSPLLMVGQNQSQKLGEICRRFGWQRPLIITDKILLELEAVGEAIRSLKKEGIENYTIYDGVLPDPSFETVEEAITLLTANNCDSVIAIGGGSVIDAAKLTKVAATHKKRPQALVGLFKLKNRGLPFVAVPTTAGTGSETTIAAVISDTKSQQKKIVIDHRLLPDIAILDSELNRKMPPPITAASGLDALTHAIEAYTSTMATQATDNYALAAIKLIMKNLLPAWRDGDNLKAREAMAVASFYAGLAFTRASLGYVHAIAHQFGTFYKTPHGLANGIVLPSIIQFNLKSAELKFANLAVATDLGKEGDSPEELATRFAKSVSDLTRAMEVPETLEA